MRVKTLCGFQGGERAEPCPLRETGSDSLCAKSAIFQRGSVSGSGFRDSIETRPGTSGQKIKIDVGRGESQTRNVEEIRRNHDVVRNRRPLAHVQSGEDILAGKPVSFPCSVAARNRACYRDIWDIHWLSDKGVRSVSELVRAKASFHGRPLDWMNPVLDRLGDIVGSPDVDHERRRFPPVDIIERTLENRMYLEAIASRTKEFLKEAAGYMDHDRNEAAKADRSPGRFRVADESPGGAFKSGRAGPSSIGDTGKSPSPLD